MDDNSFDKIIKHKAENFHDTGHDPHALEDMRRRLAHIPRSKSGWVPGKMATLGAAMLLFTAINFGIVWYFSEGQYASLTEEMTQLKSERGQFIDLQEDLQQLKHAKGQSKVDTVYVYREIFNTIGNSTPQGFTQQSVDNNIRVQSGRGSSQTYLSGNNQFLLLDDDEELSEELQHFLTRHNLLLMGTDGNRLLVVNDQAVAHIGEKAAHLRHGSTGPLMPNYLPNVLTIETNRPKKEKVERRQLSQKTLWALEKHAHSGVDLQFGVEGFITKSLFDIGQGDINNGLGLLTEVIFSPALRLETGLQITARSYTLKEGEINGLEPGALDNYPGLDPQVGQLIRLESDSKLLKVPFNLKLMGILDHNKKWYVSAGVTPQWVTTQELDYQYAIDNPGDPPGDVEFRSFIGAKQEANPGFYAGTLNLGVGTEVFISDRTRLQLGVYYEKGLSEAGVEKRKLQGFGVKSSFWFNR